MDPTIVFALFQILIILTMMALPLIGILFIIRMIARPIRKTIKVFKN